MKITVKKFGKAAKQQMKNVSPGYLVKADGGIYAITSCEGTALMLNHSDRYRSDWYQPARRMLDEYVEVIGKIKNITFEIE